MKFFLPTTILLFALLNISSGHAHETTIEAKNIPCGPLFEIVQKDNDPLHPVIQCYRNVCRITDDRRYRLFDHRLQRWGMERVHHGILAPYDDYKEPSDPGVHLQDQQVRALKSRQGFLYYAYDSQIYLVEDKPEVYLEPVAGEHFYAVTSLPFDNKLVYVSWGIGEGKTSTCLDSTSKTVVWKIQDPREMLNQNEPSWLLGQLYWVDARYLATFAQGRIRSIISIFDTKTQKFIKGEDEATWYRICGHRVLQIDRDENGGRHVSTYFDPAHSP